MVEGQVSKTFFCRGRRASSPHLLVSCFIVPSLFLFFVLASIFDVRTARLGAQWGPNGRFGPYLGGPGGYFGVHFGAYFGNFGACWAFGLPFGPLGFHLGAHVALLGGFWAILGSIFDLFWDPFRRHFWIIFETSFSNPFLNAFEIILGSFWSQVGP